ncbi:hypothetical protein FHX46_000446 [Amycolatopsis viridis]|uniref:Uncharacterized protein n=1 Tax=Amycolatopsis viridis TaxID=185678 RepID=A0ABX0SRD0_9PSEU|nr:hypothetical protein [Amycolatopsis viridis]
MLRHRAGHAGQPSQPGRFHVRVVIIAAFALPPAART